jgi:hypothetical protein
MVKNTATDKTTTDHHYLGMSFHFFVPYISKSNWMKQGSRARFRNFLILINR